MCSEEPHGCGFQKFELEAQMLQLYFTVNRGSRKEANTQLLEGNCAAFSLNGDEKLSENKDQTIEL